MVTTPSLTNKSVFHNQKQRISSCITERCDANRQDLDALLGEEKCRNVGEERNIIIEK